MATVSAAIKIQDGFSSALKSMSSALQLTLNSFEQVQRASGRAVDTASIEAARRELARTAQAFGDIDAEIQNAQEAQQQFNDEIRTGTSAVDGLVAKVAGIAVAVGSVLTVGSVLQGGFDRLVGIDTASAKLQALGHNAQSVDAILNDSLKSVRGTAFGLSEAVNTAASAVAAGVKPGQQLERYLSLTADTAAIAGSSLSEMGAIFNKVTTSGIIQAMELNQISDKGIPIFQLLADEIGVTSREIRKLASDGKISSDTFLKAVESGIGGAAQVLGTASFQATLDNIGASIDRIGAKFLNGAGDGKGFFDQVKPLLVDFLATLSSLEDRAVILGDIFGRAFKTIYDGASRVVNFFVSYWTIIAPIIGTIITVLLVYVAALATLSASLMITAGWQAVMAARAAYLTGATFAATAAQHGLNAALLANPIGLVVAAIIALIGVFYLAVGAVNYFAGTSISATGIIAAVFAFLWVSIQNGLIGVYNAFAITAEFLYNVFQDPVAAVGKLFVNLANNGIKLAQSLIGSYDSAATNLANLFIQGANKAIGGINKLIEAINKIPGVNLDSVGQLEVRASLSKDLGGLSNLVQAFDNALPVSSNYKTFAKKEYLSATDAAVNAYGVGAGAFKGAPAKAPSGSGIGQAISDSLSKTSAAAPKETKAAKDTAKNTKKLADTATVLSDDLKYLRDLSEREAINRYTTGEIKIDARSENHIATGQDLDGIINSIAEKLEEAVEVVAEGSAF